MKFFFFESPILNGTIYNHDSIVISHYILYTLHLYGIAIRGISQPKDSKKILLLLHDSSSVLLVLVVLCDTNPVSFI